MNPSPTPVPASRLPERNLSHIAIGEIVRVSFVQMTACTVSEGEEFVCGIRT